MSNGASGTNTRMPGKMEGFGGGGHLGQSSGIFDGFNPEKKQNNYSSSNKYETHLAPSEPEPPRTMAKCMALAKSKKKNIYGQHCSRRQLVTI